MMNDGVCTPLTLPQDMDIPCYTVRSSHPTKLEQSIFLEINRARGNPSAYAARVLCPFKKNILDNGIPDATTGALRYRDELEENFNRITSESNANAHVEACNELPNVEALSEFELS
jgi:hypothetical protein